MFTPHHTRQHPQRMYLSTDPDPREEEQEQEEHHKPMITRTCTYPNMLRITGEGEDTRRAYTRRKP